MSELIGSLPIADFQLPIYNTLSIGVVSLQKILTPQLAIGNRQSISVVPGS
jgi:hypothetical protein